MRYNGGLAFLSRQAPPVEENKYYTTLTLNIHRSMLDVYNSLINITCLTHSLVTVSTKSLTSCQLTCPPKISL